jgi:predicted transcriptional regulator
MTVSLGDLERGVMEVFWASDDVSLTVREVATSFPDHAYTTIMTVTSRLAAKGFLVESKVGRINHFRATASREVYITSLILDALSSTTDRQAVLARFAESMLPSDKSFLHKVFSRRSRG